MKLDRFEINIVIIRDWIVRQLQSSIHITHAFFSFFLVI